MSDSSTLGISTEPTIKNNTVLTTNSTTGGMTSNAVILGFLSIVSDSSGVFGGYLVTNSWGRPLEFRLSTAVQPNRVQQILYGPTLTEYLHAELIGKTLVEKTTTQPNLIVTDSVSALSLRTRVGIPTLSVAMPTDANDYASLSTPLAKEQLWYLAKNTTDLPTILARLEQVDPAVDLSEPFLRIREAMLEARKMGVTNRAA